MDYEQDVNDFYEIIEKDIERLKRLSKKMEDQYCDCDRRCSKCGKLKRPGSVQWIPPGQGWGLNARGY